MLFITSYLNTRFYSPAIFRTNFLVKNNSIEILKTRWISFSLL